MQRILENEECHGGILGKSFMSIEFDGRLRRAHRVMTVGYTGEMVNIIAVSEGEVFLFSFSFRELDEQSRMNAEPRWLTIEPYEEAGHVRYSIRQAYDTSTIHIDETAFSEPKTPTYIFSPVRTGIRPSEHTGQIFTLVKRDNEYNKDIIFLDVPYRIAAAGSIDENGIDRFLILNTDAKCALIGVPDDMFVNWDGLVSEPEPYKFSVIRRQGFTYPKIYL
ncbi:MAG: hypothetical protein WCL23_05290 [Candidatus Moraniibacteriota bacterium]